MSSLGCLGDELRPPPSPVRPNAMRRNLVLNPIAALGFYTSSRESRIYLLAAEDNRLSVYDVETFRLCGEVQIFPAQSVHGIQVTPKDGATQRILAWGGYSVAVILTQTIEDIISGEVERRPTTPLVIIAKASDWIFEGVLSPHGTDDLALLTAHNDLITARYDEEKGLIDFVGIDSPSRPILYSGNLSWDESNSILVAAGTVFGEIVIWRYSITPQEQQPHCNVLFVFSGHEGSIFGVNISPIFTLETGESLRLLASCSDDRTIRVWDITDPRDVSSHTRDGYQKKMLAVRETGFGDQMQEVSQEGASARCLATAMGHISRIWQVEFPKQETLRCDSFIDLWSFGEDATAQRWSLELDDGKGATSGGQTTNSDAVKRGVLKLAAVYANHSGKNIWSHAMTVDKSGQPLVITGGSDGKISIIGNSQKIIAQKVLGDIPSAPEMQNIDIPDVQRDEITNVLESVDTVSDNSKIGSANNAEDSTTQQSPKKPKKPKVKRPSKDFFNRYALLSDGTLLTSSKNGRFFVGNVTHDTDWQELFLPGGFKEMSSTYAVVKGSHYANTAYVGTADGDVFSYRITDPFKLTHLAQVNGKISDIFPLAASRLLVTVLGADVASLLEIDDPATTQRVRQIDVPVDMRFTVTSAALDENLLILGSRTGYISVTESTVDGPYRLLALMEPKTNDCVTAILAIPTRSTEESLYFLTTSRDGKYRIYSLSHHGESSSIKLLHETAPPFGPIIEGAWFFDNQDGSKDLILYGFRSTKFVIWNETKRQEVATIDCGGGHRTFCYDPLPGSFEKFRIVWTQASKLNFFSQIQAPHTALKSGGHGREIKAISASGDLIATAAEDTAIRIWSYTNSAQAGQKQPKCLAVLDSHTAGIQSVKWYKQSHLFSSGGNKEFFIWRISHLKAEYRGLAVKCEAIYPDRTDDIDLRIMNFDVHGQDGATSDEPFFYISMALSNSTLLTYSYSEQAGFTLIANGSYTGACMTQLRHLHLDDTSIQILTTATDGHITIWEAKLPMYGVPQISTYSGLVVTKLHQSTMKSLDVRRVTSENRDTYLVVTGGDDNGLGVARLSRDKTLGTFTVESKAIVRSAHAAAVTGIAVLNLTPNGKDAIVVSCSNDQRVKRWQIKAWQSENLRISLIDNLYSSIADSGDLAVLEEGRSFAVGGVGLEVWNAGYMDDIGTLGRLTERALQ